MPETRAAGTIYDLGYQRYTGERLGRGNAIWRLMQYSFKAAYGVGRGPRARRVPLIVAIITIFPAIGQVTIANLTGQMGMINYGLYLNATTFFIALFAAAQAPEIVVPDRQYGVLSLYLSRPLYGTDYALAKLGAMVLAMLALTLSPQLFLFIGKVVLNATPWQAFKDEFPKLLPIFGGTLATSLYVGSIGLAIASFCSRRAFANAGIIAFFMLLPAAAAIIRNLATGEIRRYAVLAHPMWLITGFTNWLFDIEARRRSVIGRADLPGQAYLWTLLATAALFIGLLMWRYRRSEA